MTLQLEATASILAQGNDQLWWTSDFGQKVTVAIVAAILGFSSSLAIEQLRRRREPRRRLSWSADIQDGLISVKPEIRERVKVLYDGSPVETLSSVQCSIANVGNRVVKTEYVRFDFQSETTILAAYFDPEPQPEMSVKDFSDDSRRSFERKFEIGHLEVGQSVTFRFVLSGNQPLGNWAPIPFNAEGDVAFSSKELTRARKDQEHIPNFVLLILLAVIIPPTLSLLPLGGFISQLLYLVILAFLLPHIMPIARLIQQIVTAVLDRSEKSTISIFSSQGIQVGDNNDQDNAYRQLD